MKPERSTATRYSRAFAVSAGLLILAFLADTASTAACGLERMAFDLNPVVRRLSLTGYLAWSAVRLAVALALLTLFWPARLTLCGCVRRRGPWLAIFLPFSYRKPRTYVVAALCCVVGPLKLAAACSNLFLLATDQGFLPREILIGVGLLVGVLTSNALLLWHSSLLSRVVQGPT
jgi:hypothetical protein